METNKRLVRVREAADQLSLSRSKVYNMMESGELPFVKFGRARRIRVEAVEELIRSKEK